MWDLIYQICGILNQHHVVELQNSRKQSVIMADAIVEMKIMSNQNDFRAEKAWQKVLRNPAYKVTYFDECAERVLDSLPGDANLYRKKASDMRCEIVLCR